MEDKNVMNAPLMKAKTIIIDPSRLERIDEMNNNTEIQNLSQIQIQQINQKNIDDNKDYPIVDKPKVKFIKIGNKLIPIPIK